ncbi:MAG: tetratricopeptide repeat protein [Deltaproteobacteria bacterium]|nr:tetratricopeptide repeat protein [Deltaproteobacteria bacterium]
MSKAVSAYNKAISIRPSNPPAHANFGKLYAQVGNVNQAISEYEKSLQVDPLLNLALEGLATLYRLQGDLSKAESYAKILRHSNRQ